MEIGHIEVVHDVKIDYYGQRLASASSDSTVKIIALSSNAALKHLATLLGHQGPVMQVAWAHPKFGSILASCSREGRVIIWKEVNPNEWTQARIFHEHKSYVSTISWAPHELGLCLACGSSDGSISVHIARSDGVWETSRIGQAHSGGVTSLMWLPAMVPGAMLGCWLFDPLLKLVSGGSDNTVRVWKFCNGKWKMECLPATLQVHSDSAKDVATAPTVGLPKSTIEHLPHDDVGSGAPNVGLPKSNIDHPPLDDVGSGAPNVGLLKSNIDHPPLDVGSGSPSVELPKSTSASPPQDDMGSSYPNAELTKSTPAGPPQDDIGPITPNAELSKSTIASPPQDDVGSVKFKRNHWSTEEDELLVRAWLDIAKGAAEGNDQKLVPLWKQITKYYEDKRKGDVARTWNQLQSRWTKIKLGVRKFVECYDQASQECEEETSEAEIIMKAHKLYQSQNDDRWFPFEHAWMILKGEPKWKVHVNLLDEEGSSKRIKVSEPGACISSSNPENLTSGDIGSSEEHDIRPAKKPAKSSGNSKDDVKSKEALTLELQAIKSAELKKAVALEDLARTKQMEIDMQIIYKNTSSMSEEQLQFHLQLVQRLKQKYLL